MKEKLNILRVSKIKKYYNDFLALDNVNLNIKCGEFVALLGPNGAGKSTLFSILSGMIQADEGDCLIDGNNIIHKSVDALKKLGIVFQQPTIDMELTVIENLFFHARLHGISLKNLKHNITKELETYKLETKINKKVRTLSGGERRKIELIRALLHSPRVLLMDEPTVGLDPKSRQDLLSKILKLKNTKGLSVLWTTHLVDEAEKADKIIILNKGKVLKEGNHNSLIREASTNTLGEAFLKLTEGEK